MAEAIRNQVWPFLSAWIYQFFRAGVPAISVVLFYAALVSNNREIALGLVAIAGAVLLIWVSSLLSTKKRQTAAVNEVQAAKDLFAQDLLPSYLCNSAGEIVWQNQRAKVLSSENAPPTATIANVLSSILPNADATVRRLTSQAKGNGNGTEKLIGLSGRVDLNVHQIGSQTMWRFDLKANANGDEQHETAMLTVGKKGTILFMNQSARSLIGARIKSIEKLFPKGLPVTGRVQNMRVEQGVVRVRVDIQHLKAERSHIFLTPTAVGSGSENFALKDLPIPLLQITLAGKIYRANVAALSLLGYSDLKGRSLTEVFDSHGVLFQEWIERAKDARAPIDAEFLRVKGATKETIVQVALKRIEVGEEACLIAILTDATKLKSLEAQFVQSQKMQAIGQLAGGVAHDFNNLLTAISGHCDLMLLRHDAGDLDYADLMQIHQNANRAAGLVGQLLAFSRKQTLQLEHLDLRDTLSDLTHLLNRLVGETVTLTLFHDPVLRAVRADRRQLEQVIMNLVVNARDAMPQGGGISIQTESMTLSTPLRRDRVTVPIGDYIVVRVRDEGIGIEKEALQKIFEPFYTTKRVGEGTGLGLSTAYGIVKQTGGFIFADSELGQGTCFSLLFPASDLGEKLSTKVDNTLPTLAKDLCSGVVLLVEDEAPVRAFASRALNMRGFTVIEADSAESALELLQDPSLEVDVFVTDVVMPGMDGPTWVQKAMLERPGVKVVFVSGYAEGAFQGKSPQLSGSVFLPKPFSLVDLTATVQDQLAD